jgi:hypothetical protein
MANSPNPFETNLSRPLIIGGVMAAGGIVLFLIIYAALASAGVDALARVVLALCVPPAIMALVMGGYFLWGRGRTNQKE